MTNTNRTITIYNLSSATNEFIGKGDGYIPANTGLPAYSTDIAPPSATAGFVAVFNFESEKWSLVEDHRGKTVYDIHTGETITISQLGALPDDVISIAPEGHFVKWDGKNGCMMLTQKNSADYAGDPAKRKPDGSGGFKNCPLAGRS